MITNVKSYMSFRLVPKSVTLNYLERRNGLYFALSYRILQSCQALSSSWSWRFLVLVLFFVLTCMVLFFTIRYLGHPLTSTGNFTEIVPGEPLRRGI